MHRYAIINNSGTVINVVQWDGNTGTWQPGSGQTAVQSDTANVNDTYAGGVFTPPTPPPPTPAEDAAALINGGLALTSTGTPSLNGTYACGPSSQANINAVITYILVNGTFPGGNSTMPWIDAGGEPHVFPDVTHFKDFASAVANFVAQATLYGDSGGSIGSLPSNAVTID